MFSLIAGSTAAALLNLPSLPSPVEVFQAVDALVYAADRQRDEVISGTKRAALGFDALSTLDTYALPPLKSTIAITGATDGIGKEAAAFLANAGYGVILLARDSAKAEKTVDYLRGLKADARVMVVTADLASIESVEASVSLIEEAAQALGSPLRGLMLNAGIWPGKLQITSDGMELALQANHIGHFHLTQRLMPVLERVRQAEGPDAPEARVVTTSSSAHAFARSTQLDDPLWQRDAFDTNANYARAKFCNLLFAQELAERAPPGIRSVATHPGVVLTTLFKELGPDYQEGSNVSPTGNSAVEDRLAGIPALRTLQANTPLKVVLKSPEEGARPLLYSLLAPGLPTGSYVVDCEVRDVAPAAKDAAARKELWEWTREWIEGNLPVPVDAPGDEVEEQSSSS